MKSAQEMAEEYAANVHVDDEPSVNQFFAIQSKKDFLAGHSSRDAEVKALEERIKDLAHLLVQE